VLLSINAILLIVFLVEYVLITLTENLKTLDDVLQSEKFEKFVTASGYIGAVVDFFVALGVGICSILSIVRLRRHFGSRFAKEKL
jgi:uncharacterized membrane protein